MFFRIKGTQDVFDYRLIEGVLQIIEHHLQNYNFSQISTPILESVSLFERGLGFQTDVVSKQMFIVQSKSESESICLRPEITAGTVRAFVEQQGSLVLPWKVFSYGPVFRYERPQKGRYRQFHQVSIESLGTDNVVYDAFFISMLSNLFAEKLEIENFVLHVNFLGQQEDREIFKTHLYAFLSEHDAILCATCKQRKETNILRVFDCKVEACHNVYKQAPKITDHLTPASQAEWQLVQDQLLQLSVTFVHDPYLVRGLDYYNKTVFEFIGLTLGAQSTFCGGGRYDSLAQQLGSKDQVAAIGAGIGMERLLLMLEGVEEKFATPRRSLVCIVPCALEQNGTALLIADHLQAAGVCVDLLLDTASLKSKLRKADKLQAKYAVVIGEVEQQQNFVMIKNMMTGQDEKVFQADLENYFKSLVK
ncbi:histidine--tRNA ligase [Candidatus Babeliales bacterium]|nr:histidine--tRNA ligase [Candidatus Babeliales bacterium]MBP9844123.1 histidine--tRNA ligase [Candidatus Babeliales bacterium]